MKIGQLLHHFSSRAASLLSHGGHAGMDSTHDDEAAPTLSRRLAGLLPWRPRATAPARSALEETREAFLEALRDIDAREACCLSMRIRYAPSLQALWHFRTDIFLLVSLHRSESEAHTRLANLNQHFPTRSPRSGFGALLD